MLGAAAATLAARSGARVPPDRERCDPEPARQTSTRTTRWIGHC
jgi:hypothetical protein